jgi:hypothetical protein
MDHCTEDDKTNALLGHDRDGTEIVFALSHGLSPSNSGSENRLCRKLEIQERWALASGRRFAVVTPRILFCQPMFFSNWAVILRYVVAGRRIKHEDLADRATRMVEARSRCCLREIEQQFAGNSLERIRIAVFSAVHRGDFRAEVSVMPLSVKTVLTPNRD